jgi:hypothetical protein
MSGAIAGAGMRLSRRAVPRAKRVVIDANGGLPSGRNYRGSMEDLSVAALTQVAAVAGYSISRRSEGSMYDCTIHSEWQPTNAQTKGPRIRDLNVQLKAVHDTSAFAKEWVRLDEPSANYFDKFRVNDVQSGLFVVLVLDRHPVWLRQDERQLVLPSRLYWVEPSNAVFAKSGKSMHVPRSNMFTPKKLTQLMQAL